MNRRRQPHFAATASAGVVVLVLLSALATIALIIGSAIRGCARENNPPAPQQQAPAPAVSSAYPHRPPLLAVGATLSPIRKSLTVAYGSTPGLRLANATGGFGQSQKPEARATTFSPPVCTGITNLRPSVSARIAGAVRQAPSTGGELTGCGVDVAFRPSRPEASGSRRTFPPSLVTDDMLARLSRAESGGSSTARGDQGRSRGLFQFRETAWKQASRVRRKRGLPTWSYSFATDPAVSHLYARSYLEWLRDSFTAARGFPPSEPTLVALWNAGPRGFQRRGFTFAPSTRQLLARMD